MPSAPHIAIIGAGPIGLSAADSLLDAGARITLIERKDGPGRGASLYNSAMIHPSQAMPWFDCDHRRDAARSTYALACRSRELLIDKFAAMGLGLAQDDGGCVQLFDSEEDLSAASEIYDSLGVTRANPPDGVTFGLPALFFPYDFKANALDYCEALSRSIEARGGKIVYDRRAEIRHDGDSVTGVMLKDAMIRADHVIVATGAQSPEFLASTHMDLPIVSVKGWALSFERPDMALPEPPIMHYNTRSALTVLGDTLRLSGATDLTGAQDLLDIWMDIAPDIVTAIGAPHTQWEGYRPVSQLGHPLIGPTEIDGLWVNTGHGHMGWTLCAGSGELMAKMIMDGVTDARFELA